MPYCTVHQGCASEPKVVLLLQAGEPELSTYRVAPNAAVEQIVTDSASKSRNGVKRLVHSNEAIKSDPSLSIRQVTWFLRTAAAEYSSDNSRVIIQTHCEMMRRLEGDVGTVLPEPVPLAGYGYV